MTDSLKDYDAFRGRMNDIILYAGNLTINRFFALDHRCYRDSAPPAGHAPAGGAGGKG